MDGRSDSKKRTSSDAELDGDANDSSAPAKRVCTEKHYLRSTTTGQPSSIAARFGNHQGSHESALRCEVDSTRLRRQREIAGTKPLYVTQEHSIGTYISGYVERIGQLAMTQEFEFRAMELNTRQLRSWTIATLIHRARFIWQLIDYCTTEEQVEMRPELAVRIFCPDSIPTESSGLSTITDDDIKTLLIKLVKMNVINDDDEKDAELTVMMEIDSMLKGIMYSVADKRYMAGKMYSALCDFHKFWDKNDKSGPREMLSCMVSFVTFIREHADTHVYNRVRIRSKFKRGMFPATYLTTEDERVSKTCALLHEFVQKQLSAHTKTTRVLIDHIPYIKFEELHFNDVYRAVFILASPQHDATRLEVSNDKIISSLFWILHNYRPRGSMAKGETNISYMKEIKPYLNQYRFTATLDPLSSTDHKNLLAMLRETYKGRGSMLRLVVKENSDLEKYLVDNLFFIPGRTFSFGTSSKRSGTDKAQPVTFNQMKEHYLSTLRVLRTTPARSIDGVIDSAEAYAKRAVLKQEYDDDDNDDDVGEQNSDDVQQQTPHPSSFGPIVQMQVSSSSSMQEEKAADDDDDGDDFFTELKKAATKKERKTPKKRKQKKEEEEEEKKDDSDDEFERVYAVTEANIEAFNECIELWNKAPRDRFRKIYEQSYKKLSDVFEPTADTTLDEIELHIVERLQTLRATVNKSRKLTEGRNVSLMAYHVYIGMLFNSVMEKLAYKNGLTYNINTCRTRFDPLLKIAYEWIKECQMLNMKPRAFRRYIFLYELAYRHSYTTWLLICDISPSQMLRWSEFIHRFFMYEHVSRGSRGCMESIRRVKLPLYTMEDFTHEQLLTNADN